MYQLYYYPLNASMLAHLVLCELELDHELILVDRRRNQQKSPAYLQLNPTGRIPTLIDGELVLHESSAICLHISAQCPASNLVPDTRSEDYPKFYQYLMYLSSSLQAELMVYFYPEKYVDGESAILALKQKQQVRISDIFSVLDQALVGKDYLLGDTLSVCDYLLLMLSIWGDEIAKPPQDFTHLNRYLSQLIKRKAVKRVCQVEGFNLDQYQELLAKAAANF